MSQWRSAKAKRVLAALLRIGWRVKRRSDEQLDVFVRKAIAATKLGYHEEVQADGTTKVSVFGSGCDATIPPYRYQSLDGKRVYVTIAQQWVASGLYAAWVTFEFDARTGKMTDVRSQKQVADTF